MKKYLTIILMLTLAFVLCACAAVSKNEETEPSDLAEGEESLSDPSDLESCETPIQTEETDMKETQFYIKANGITFTADFSDSISADALRELLREGDLTIDMQDYGGFEKVGDIGVSLVKNDSQTSTLTGDIVLFQGDKMVIFYGSNSWSYSRLGKIQNVDKDELLLAFGNGSVTVSLSLSER